MKLIEARYQDICMECAELIQVGDMIFWEKKNSRHAKCKPGPVGRWLSRGNS